MITGNTFFVISNINSSHSQFTPDDRFRQTLDTFTSIRQQAPDSRIIFCDNSTIPLDNGQTKIIGGLVDLFVDYKNNLFTKHINLHGKNKGLNELLVYEHMLDAAIDTALVGRRIFKISGRYQLSSSFDITEYNKPQYYGKYVFRITPWVYNEGQGEFIKNFFNTALWSMCSTLIPEYKDLMQKIFSHMLLSGENIEVSHNILVPKDRLVILSNLGGFGHITNGEPTSF